MLRATTLELHIGREPGPAEPACLSPRGLSYSDAKEVDVKLPRRLGETRLTDLIDDRRFVETIYRVALADGIMDRVTYQDPPEDAS